MRSFKSYRTVVMAVVSGIVLCSCTATPVESQPETVINEPSPVVHVAEPDTFPIVVADTVFIWQKVNDIIAGVRIPIVFRNRSADTMFIVNCNAVLQPTLEKQTLEGWSIFLMPATNECLSAPIIISPGDSISDTLQIQEGIKEIKSPVPGTYRLLLRSVVWNYKIGVPNFGDTVPEYLRVSDSFAIREPSNVK